MNYECCSIQKLRFEIESWLENPILENSEVLKIEITRCPVIEGTYDLKIKKEEDLK